jgi:hypothetical protein
MKQPRSKYLVYTSAGDNANIHFWLKSFDEQKVDKNFDLWITYYGDQEDRYKEISDYYNIRKGAKFPNLLDVYQKWNDILANYEAVFVLDDDIVIDCIRINRLFEIREEYDLWLLQPAFDPRGKISWQITKINPSCFLRYTNFVENGCVLFRRDKLDQFMKVYDPELFGWGIDLWYLHEIGEHPKKIAVIDAITCINPHDSWKKGGQREFEKLEGTSAGVDKWLEFMKKNKIRFNGKDGKFHMKQFGYVKKYSLKNEEK